MLVFLGLAVAVWRCITLYFWAVLLPKPECQGRAGFRRARHSAPRLQPRHQRHGERAQANRDDLWNLWHRYTHRLSERRRTGFSKFGHYDMWLIDELQLLVERNHGVHLYPGCTNTADFCDTTERFGTVPLHSAALAQAMSSISLPPGVTSKITADQQYLCARMGTPAPLLPVHGEKECTLFSKMIRTTTAGQFGNYEQMALDWCAKVDGIDISSKLPVYLRTLHARWQRNERARLAVETAAPGEVVLARINEETALALLGSTLAAATPYTAAAASSCCPYWCERRYRCSRCL
mmetsp:Transcript_84917/g.169949  ORF Transcript_84917/g.169949 Transcript_84917/m.169949 type:complete len:293 (-) Transcript_84917:493-1371(-)